MPQRDAPHRLSTLATAGCFFVPLALYVSTAARTVQGGDTGEFANIGFLGGVPHPPGYPLFAVLLRLAALLPLGPPFFRVSLLSCMCGAAAVAVLQRATFRLTSNLTASVIAALAFAVTREQWLLAGVPEVFALNALLAALLLLLGARLAQAENEHRSRELLLLGVTGGLGLANHLSIIWCFPLVIWAVWSALRHSPRVGMGKQLGALVAGGLLGISPYLLLPVMARTASPDAFVWGHVDTLDGFLAHVLRREYGTFRLGKGPESVGFHFAPVLVYLKALPRDYLFVFFIAGLTGIAVGLRRRMSWVLACTASFLLAGVFFTALFNGPTDAMGRAIEERFYVLSLLLFAPLVGLGLAEALRWQGTLVRGAALLTVIVGAVLTGPDVNWSKDGFIEGYFVALLQQAAPKAVIVGQGDTAFPAVRWITRVLHIRPDVHYVERTLLRKDWYETQLKRELPDYPGMSATDGDTARTAALLAKTHPTYTTWWVEYLVEHQLTMIPDGFLERVVAPGTPEPTPAEQEAKLAKAAAIIGDQPPEPIEQQNSMVRLAAGEFWLRVGKQFDTAGNHAEAERCRAHGLYWIPLSGLGEEWYHQIAHETPQESAGAR